MRASVRAGVAFASETDALSITRASLDADLERFDSVYQTLSAARGAAEYAGEDVAASARAAAGTRAAFGEVREIEAGEIEGHFLLSALSGTEAAAAESAGESAARLPGAGVCVRGRGIDLVGVV